MCSLLLLVQLQGVRAGVCFLTSKRMWNPASERSSNLGRRGSDWSFPMEKTESHGSCVVNIRSCVKTPGHRRWSAGVFTKTHVTVLRNGPQSLLVFQHGLNGKDSEVKGDSLDSNSTISWLCALGKREFQLPLVKDRAEGRVSFSPAVAITLWRCSRNWQCCLWLSWWLEGYPGTYWMKAQDAVSFDKVRSAPFIERSPAL